MALAITLALAAPAHGAPAFTVVPDGVIAQAAPGSRGALLYQNHCIECHTAQMHWRARRAATDWPSLVAQVARWQGEARLNWNTQDINEVARHLNERYYHFALPRTTGSRPAPAPQAATLSARALQR